MLPSRWHKSLQIAPSLDSQCLEDDDHQLECTLEVFLHCHDQCDQHYSCPINFIVITVTVLIMTVIITVTLLYQIKSNQDQLKQNPTILEQSSLLSFQLCGLKKSENLLVQQTINCLFVLSLRVIYMSFESPLQ